MSKKNDEKRIETTRVPRSLRTPATIAREVVWGMEELYLRLQLKKDKFSHDLTDRQKKNKREKIITERQHFKKQMLSPLEEETKDGARIGDQLEIELFQWEEQNDQSAPDVMQIKLALAFAVDAQRTYQNGDINQAWSYAVDAAYWAAIITGANILSQERAIYARGKNPKNQKDRETKEMVQEYYKATRKYHSSNEDFSAEAEKHFQGLGIEVKESTILYKYIPNLEYDRT